MKKGKKLMAVLLSIMLALSVCAAIALTVSADSEEHHFDETMPEGAVMFFTIDCKPFDEVPQTRFLKVVKAPDGELNVYDADSFEGAYSATEASYNLEGSWDSIFGSETWSIALKDDWEYESISNLHQLASVSKTFNESLAMNTVRYFSVDCTMSGYEPQTKYLKAVKTWDNKLNVYEANSLEGAVAVTEASADLFGTWDNLSDPETWTVIATSPDCIEISNFKELTSVSDTFGESFEPGTVKYFSAKVVDSSGTCKTTYLKTVKNTPEILSLYEESTIEKTVACNNESTNLMGTVTFEDYTETWTVNVNGTDYAAIDELKELDSLEWGGTVAFYYSSAEALPEGETRYYRADILSRNEFDAITTTRFIKAVKSNDALTVYEAASLSGAVAGGMPSTELTGIWNYDQSNNTETWTISVSGPDYLAVSYCEEVKTVLEVSDLPTNIGLPAGATSYCKVTCQQADNSLVEKYLKVVKSNGSSLEVYSENTLADAVTSSDVDVYFKAVSVVSGDAAPYSEKWILTLAPDSNYSRILTFSPLSTIVTATKSWDGIAAGSSGYGYIDVANGTTLEFELIRNGAVEKTFYVKKAADRLQVSEDNITYSDDCLVYGDKALNVLLVPANGYSQPEQWRITFTGYNRKGTNGSVTNYAVSEKEIISSTQHWIKNSETTVQTYDGEIQHQNFDVSYTLKLRTGSGKEFDVLRITKEVSHDKVSRITVEGLNGRISPDSPEYTFATVTEARCGEKTQLTDFGNKITFTESSDISLNDIISQAGGVTVYFNTGVDNGMASVTIRLTPSGELSYEFKNLPADVYSIDPGSSESILTVDSYKVETNKKASY